MGVWQEKKELSIKHGGGGWGEAGQENRLGSSRNSRDTQLFAPYLLLIQAAQRKEDAWKGAQVRSRELEELWVLG